MSKKDYLNQAYELNRVIKLKKAELCRLRDEAEKINSSNFKDDCVSTSRINDCMSEIISRIVDYENEIKGDEVRYTKIKREISEVINGVDDVILKLILKMRHLDFMTMEQIANYIHYSRTETYRKYNVALKQINEMGQDGIEWYGNL